MTVTPHAETPVEAVLLLFGTEPMDLAVADREPARPVRQVSRLRAVAVRHTSAVRLLTGADAVSSQLDAVPSGDAARVGDLLREGPLRDPSHPVVAVALDRVAQIALWEAVQDLQHVVVVSTFDAADRMLDLLARGASVSSILYQGGFSVAGCLAFAAPGAADEGHQVVWLDPQEPGPAAAWLHIEPDRVVVVPNVFTGRARQAVASRGGARRDLSRGDLRGRLTIGPANYAGQAWEWARSVRAHTPGWDARNVHVFAPRAALSFGADLPVVSTDWQEPVTRLDIAIDYLLPSTHVLVEAMRPLVAAGAREQDADAWDPRRGREDVDALRSSGRRVALLFHGSEVRRPEVHAELTSWSPFFDGRAPGFTEALTRTTTRVHAALQGFDGPMFVSTPDLLDYLPGATWLPVVVGPGSFAPTPPALERDRPVVAHAPSSSVLKGSEWVDPVLRRLDDLGLICYCRVENIPPISMQSFLQDVDVVVDQIVLGNPGVLAAQAMAAGRLVVAHLPEAVRRRFPVPPPVVEATPETIEHVIFSILEDRDHFAQVAARGVAFARAHHDGRLSAQVLEEGFLR